MYLPVGYRLKLKKRTLWICCLGLINNPAHIPTHTYTPTHVMLDIGMRDHTWSDTCNIRLSNKLSRSRLTLTPFVCVCVCEAHYADLPASPAGLLGRFASLCFVFCARISLASLPRALRFALASRLLRARVFRASRSRKFKKKNVSIDSKCSETHRNAKKKKFTPLIH